MWESFEVGKLAYLANGNICQLFLLESVLALIYQYDILGLMHLPKDLPLPIFPRIIFIQPGPCIYDVSSADH